MSKTSEQSAESIDSKRLACHELTKFFENTEIIVSWLLERLHSTLNTTPPKEIQKSYEKLSSQRRAFTPYPFIDVEAMEPQIKDIVSEGGSDKESILEYIRRLWHFNLAVLIYLVWKEQDLEQVVDLFFERALPTFMPCTEEVLDTYLAIVSRQLYHEVSQMYENYESDEEGPNAMPLLTKRLRPDPVSGTFENIPSWKKLEISDFKDMANDCLRQIQEFDALEDWDAAMSKEHALKKVLKLTKNIEYEIEHLPRDFFEDSVNYKKTVLDHQEYLYKGYLLEKRSQRGTTSESDQTHSTQRSNRSANDEKDHQDVLRNDEEKEEEEEEQQVSNTGATAIKRENDVEDQVALSAKRRRVTPPQANVSDSDDTNFESAYDDQGSQQQEEDEDEYRQPGEATDEEESPAQRPQPKRGRRLPTSFRRRASPILDTTNGRSEEKLRKVNEYWTPNEVEALEEGVRRFGRRWARIKKEYPVALERRSQVQLKDKARNIVRALQREGKDLGVFAKLFG